MGCVHNLSTNVLRTFYGKQRNSFTKYNIDVLGGKTEAQNVVKEIKE